MLSGGGCDAVELVVVMFSGAAMLSDLVEIKRQWTLFWDSLVGLPDAIL